MTRALSTQVAVVGAGPAGMAAAVEVARAGGRVLMIDEALRAGGQIYRQPPAEFATRSSHAQPPSHEHGHHLIDQVREFGIEIVAGATVWGAVPGRLLLEIDGAPASCAWERLILAAGAYDRSVPFPGWTLPGVITAGAAQVMVRGYMVKPGTRALVAGRVLLLDEPLGSLDRHLRDRLVAELPDVLAATGTAAIHVTHDHDEAFALGDRIGVMADGRLHQTGPPAEVWAAPRSLVVARVLGHTNVVEAER